MGGTKKKPISQSEKSQAAPTKKEAKPKGKDAPKSPQQRQSLATRRVDDKEALKILGSVKAITLYGAARSLGVNASTALVTLRGLESKGLVLKVGGYSGHYVWTIAGQPTS